MVTPCLLNLREFADRFRGAALAKLIYEFGGNILEYCLRQANFINAFELYCESNTPFVYHAWE